MFGSSKKRIAELEQKLQEAEENVRKKNEFLTNLSHDLRTPMNAIIGYTELAIFHISDKPKVADCLEKTSHSCDHLLELINDVLEISRIESGDIELEEELCDLDQILFELDEMIQGQVEKKNIKLKMSIDNVRHIHVFCDRLRMDQILMNLLTNAINYTPNGGEVTLMMNELEDIDDLHATYELRVRDTGKGMTEEQIGKIFEPFEKVKYSSEDGEHGVGLGLAITKHIVDMMGGTIDLSTAVGEGTEFILQFPLRRKSMSEAVEARDRMSWEERKKKMLESAGEAANSDKDELHKVEADYSGKRALLVDDNMINREIAKAILTRYGFELEEATDGDEALEAIEEAEVGYYDIVFMDIQMPRMNGYDATQAIRALGDERSHVPIVAMTANAFEEDINKAAESGMNGHIAKPIDIAGMVETINEVFADPYNRII